MVSKVLKKMEVLRGFIQIPEENKFELIGDTSLPCVTTLNGNPARLDKYGRLWSPSMKNKFLTGTRVEISRTENGYRIEPILSEQEQIISEMKQKEEAKLTGLALGKDTTEILSKLINQIIEGDSIQVMKEIPDNSVDMSFADPPFNLNKSYEYYEDDKEVNEYLAWCKE